MAVDPANLRVLCVKCNANLGQRISAARRKAAAATPQVWSLPQVMAEKRQREGRAAAMVSRELAGRVYVDHGRVVVCDPQYVALSERDADALLDGDVVRLDLGEALEDGPVDHVAVAVASGWGDGWYPAWIEREDVDGVPTVARLVVDFLTTDEGARELDRSLASAGVEDDVRRRALGGGSPNPEKEES